MGIIISASRRTDLPRWYLPETIQAFQAGFITLENPFNKKQYTVNLEYDNIHSIAWWSKNYRIWLEKADFFQTYNNFFNFTITGYSQPSVQDLLEKGVSSSLDQRIDQCKQLARIYSPEAVTWRFDPIVHWETEGAEYDNLADQEYIAKELSSVNISRCVISFMTLYAKTMRRFRTNTNNRVKPVELPVSQKIDIATKIGKINQQYGIKTYSCASHHIVDNHWIFPSHCIDASLLTKLFGGELSTGKDAGQRPECGCSPSTDIGSYAQKCYHACLPCYANGV